MAIPSTPAVSFIPAAHRHRLDGAGLAASLFGLIYFVAHGGAEALHPTHIGWLMREDWSQHYLGWAFFRHAPWGLPLGRIDALAYPVGTTVAFVDGNPLCALLFRPFAAWLPEPFQYLGPFMALCMAWQGYAGARLARMLGAPGFDAALAGGLFVVAPILLHRLEHDTLMAHALILWALTLALTPGGPGLQEEGGRWQRQMAVLPPLATLIHPYLLAMVLPLWGVAWARHSHTTGFLGPRRGAWLATGTGLTVAALVAALGYVGGGAALGTDGFGFYSADLTAFFNPLGWSRILPNLPTHRGQAYEGYAYMGLGNLLLIVWAAALTAARRPRTTSPRTAWALGAVLLLAAVFAWASPLCFLARPIYAMPRLYAPIEPLCAMFRASGRFIWLPYYGLMAWALQAVWRCHTPRTARAGLCAIALVQAWDVRPANVAERLNSVPKAAMTAPIWGLMQGEYAHLALFPPHFHNCHVQCHPTGYRDKIEMPPGFLAAKLKMTINSAYLSRADPVPLYAYCRALFDAVSEQPLRADTVYLVDPAYLHALRAIGRPLACWEADGYVGCVRADRPTALIRALSLRP